MGLYVHVSETQQHCCWKQDKTWDFVFALREKPLINIDSQTTMTFCWRPCMYNSKINCQHGHESLTLICSLSPNSMHIGKIQTTDKTGYLVALLECFPHSWWRHQMEPFSALLALCAGNSPVPVNSPHKGQWRGALVFSLICARINDWVNNHEAGDLRRHHGHYDFNVMCY